MSCIFSFCCSNEVRSWICRSNTNHLEIIRDICYFVVIQNIAKIQRLQQCGTFNRAKLAYLLKIWSIFCCHEIFLNNTWKTIWTVIKMLQCIKSICIIQISLNHEWTSRNSLKHNSDFLLFWFWSEIIRIRYRYSAIFTLYIK